MERSLPDLRERFAAASPFPHVVIDDFLAIDDARAIADVFPKPQGVDRVLAALFAARTYKGDLSEIDRRIAAVFESLSSPSFIAWLEGLTGIADLRIDEDFIGAGLHQAVNGSELPVHADHNTHPNDNGLYRRLNLLIYMNPVWETKWGGVLELWDRDGKAPATSVVPLLNRCIIMEVNDRAFHGYRKLRVPEGISRNAVVAYYYAPKPAMLQDVEPHPTIFARAGQTTIQRLVQRTRHGALLRILAVAQSLSNLRARLSSRPRADETKAGSDR